MNSHEVNRMTRIGLVIVKFLATGDYTLERFLDPVLNIERDILVRIPGKLAFLDVIWP